MKKTGHKNETKKVLQSDYRDNITLYTRVVRSHETARKQRAQMK